VRRDRDRRLPAGDLDRLSNRAAQLLGAGSHHVEVAGGRLPQLGERPAALLDDRVRPPAGGVQAAGSVGLGAPTDVGGGAFRRGVGDMSICRLPHRGAQPIAGQSQLARLD